jgi:HipA-like protein
VNTVTRTLRRVRATRYVTPLREGGSLPALVEADDDGLYVLKFRGAGQGPKALVAEIVAGELARGLGLPVPELVLADLDAELGRAEPDAEIQDLLAASIGLNLGMDFLPGALAYTPAVPSPPDPELAAAIVWFDALVTNVDRSPRNPNLLVWHGGLWMIDHGAALYVHHGWADPDAHARKPFAAIRDHVLLPHAGSIREADERLAPLVTEELLRSVMELVPVDWLGDGAPDNYVRYLLRRLEPPRAFVAEAEEDRTDG